MIEMDVVHLIAIKDNRIFDLQRQNEELLKALEKAKSELQWGDADNAIVRVSKFIDKALERMKP